VFVVLQANPVVNMVGLNDVFLAKQRVHFLMTLVCAAVDRVHLQERAELRSLAVAAYANDVHSKPKTMIRLIISPSTV